MDYRGKCVALALMLAVMVGASYLLAIQKTLTIRDENSLLKLSVDEMRQNESKLAERLTTLASIDSLLEGRGDIAIGTDVDWLEQLSILCLENGVRITDISDPEQEIIGLFDVQTHHVRLEGDFISLLKVIHQLEKRPIIGQVSSARFDVFKAVRARDKGLYCNLYVQQYESSERK